MGQYIGRRNVMLSAVVLIIHAFLAAESHAQTSGSIYGSVNDPSNAAIGGAIVTVKSIETNQTRRASTGQDGAYSFALLPVGPYTMGVQYDPAELLGAAKH